MAEFEWRADKRRFVVADLADVLAIGRLHKRVDAGKSRLMAATEQRDIAVDDEVRGFETKLERAPDILVLLFLRDPRQLLHRSRAIGVLAPDAVRMTVAVRMPCSCEWP